LIGTGQIITRWRLAICLTSCDKPDCETTG
jgi:hypothetical protein